LLFFENFRCLACLTEVGFDRGTQELRALTGALRCAAVPSAGCNWLAAPGAPEGLCDCCQLTQTRPPDDDQVAARAFGRAQAAQRRLLYQLDDLGLPVVDRETDPEEGLAFDLLSSAYGPVVTGHSDGLITIDLAEGDDSHREAVRVRLAEPYRTMLGHYRHEIGHWYWVRLVRTRPALPVFRALFGDERADYGAALAEHYASEPVPGWEETHVSIYATAHPWEDWAETFAHYLHIRDTVQTAAAYGIVVAGPDLDVALDPFAPLIAIPDDAPNSFVQLIDTWLPLTYALNAVNRSMGKDDLYPFVLSPTVLRKLSLVHSLVETEAHRSLAVPVPSAETARVS
jgi:hypothetical protein